MGFEPLWKEYLVKRAITVSVMFLATVASAAPAVPLTAITAKAKALALVPGRVVEVEKEKHKGEPVYSVEIKAADGVHEVILRIADGALLENKAKAADEEEEDGDGDDD